MLKDNYNLDPSLPPVRFFPPSFAQPRPQAPALRYFQNGGRFERNPGKCWSRDTHESWVSGPGSLKNTCEDGPKGIGPDEKR